MSCVVKKREAEFVRNIRCLEHRVYIEQYLLFSAAPVLAGIKPAVLISFRSGCEAAWTLCKKKICEKIGLKAVTISKKKGTFAVLIYDEEELEARIRSPAIRELLLEYGYQVDGGVLEWMTVLKARFSCCNCPHEIGLFLGYPVEDVGSFIANKGKGYLCCRHWKVYHNEQKAKEIFHFIDEARLRAVSLLERKMTIETAAKMLAEMKTA